MRQPLLSDGCGRSLEFLCFHPTDGKLTIL
jgi:hypothetical protein